MQIPKIKRPLVLPSHGPITLVKRKPERTLAPFLVHRDVQSPRRLAKICMVVLLVFTSALWLESVLRPAPVVSPQPRVITLLAAPPMPKSAGGTTSTPPAPVKLPTAQSTPDHFAPLPKQARRRQYAPHAATQAQRAESKIVDEDDDEEEHNTVAQVFNPPELPPPLPPLPGPPQQAVRSDAPTKQAAGKPAPRHPSFSVATKPPQPKVTRAKNAPKPAPRKVDTVLIVGSGKRDYHEVTARPAD